MTALFHAFEPAGVRRAIQISRHIGTASPPQLRKPSWERLVRYVSASDGGIRYGDPILGKSGPAADIDGLALKGELEVWGLEDRGSGDEGEWSLAKLVRSGERDRVKRLLGPLTPRDVPVVRCVGLNYTSHIKETGMDIPQNPTLFTKPPMAVANTRETIPIPKMAQNSCDYEAELTIVMRSDCKDVSPENALDYVAGYTAGNDLSCRDWQLQTSKAGKPPQWTFSKSFDKFAPLGPCIVRADLLGDASGLGVKTWVNGELRQEAQTGDLCFGVRELVSALSRGTTLQAGSLIMTGTPGGVGMGFKPPRYLSDGDEVVVEIGGIGRVVNEVHFE